MLLPNVCPAKDCAARSGQGSFAVFQGSFAVFQGNFAVREPRGIKASEFRGCCGLCQVGESIKFGGER